MKQILKRIHRSQIRIVVADREFIGQEWFTWLQAKDIPFAIRIKENAIVTSGHKDIPLRKLFANLQIHQETILRKPRLVYGHSLYLCAIRFKDEFLIIASKAQGQWALDAYKKRWGIEVFFANLKSRGFDLEATHLVHEDRIEKLVAIVAIAFSWAHIVGEWIAKHHPLKIKKHGYREKSLFRYGLDYLQYLLLNSRTHQLEFKHCLRLLNKL